MSIDRDNREPEPPEVDLWSLPEVLSVEAVRVRYEEPRIRAVGPQLVEMKEAVEILVRTAGEIPVRALAPVLFVGNIPITESETVRENLYRFLAFDADRLKRGALISIGWTGTDRKIKTKFRYEVSGEQTK